MAREDLSIAFRPGSLNGKTELCTPLSEAPCSFLPRSCVSCANPQPCPAFPERPAKPSYFLLLIARSSKLGLGYVGIVTVQLWKSWLIGVHHWKYPLWRWSCRGHLIWRKQLLSESARQETKRGLVVFFFFLTFQLLPDCCNHPIICCIILHPSAGGTWKAALLFNHLPLLLTCG